MNTKSTLSMAMAALAVAAGAAGCARIQEPWVNNGLQWKQSSFATQPDDAELRQRLARSQADR